MATIAQLHRVCLLLAKAATMSLINQMLRDLEQRNSTSAKPSVPEPLQVQKVALPNQSSKHGNLWWLAIVVICLALAVVQYYPYVIPATPLSTVTTPAQPAALQIAPAIAEQTLPVVPTQEPQPPLENKLPTKTTITQEANAPINTPAATSKQSVTPKTSNSTPKKPAPNSQKQPPASKIVSTDTTSQSGLSADTLYRQADSSPSGTLRKSLLRDALTLNPRHLAARKLLLQTLQQENASIELKQFLDESLELFPGDPGFTTALAHWQIKQKNADAAINMLESIDSRQNHDPQFLALKAAGYQQQHNYAQALPLYQELTHIQPDKAENWLGLAVCADNLQQPSRAIQAYQLALNKKTLNSDVVDYIRLRLSALNN